MKTRVVLIMGVSGSGKTTVGRLLAERLGWAFRDGDDFHPPENVRKMASGAPLGDQDRLPWLLRIGNLVEESASGREAPAVVACSALRSRYRKLLIPASVADRVAIVFLRGDEEQIRSRMEARSGHFMPARLLASQFATLEEPQSAIVADISLPPEAIVQSISEALK